jgi:hypothetical protein
MENNELKHLLMAYKSTVIGLQTAHDEILSLLSVVVPKGTLCLSCKKELATNGMGETKTVCSNCWNSIIS